MITKNPDFLLLLEAHDKLRDQKIDLEIENARLREAAEHYQQCDDCNSRFICVEGQLLAVKAKMNYKHAKVV